MFNKKFLLYRAVDKIEFVQQSMLFCEMIDVFSISWRHLIADANVINCIAVATNAGTF